jgi:DNA-binding response OmpR family regulator
MQIGGTHMGKQRILVVDDREALLAAIQDILEIEGYTILTATDGMKALKVMEETRPDLIVADILMPQMDGYAFYEAVRARQDWGSIPFIFLTAKAEREDVSKGIDLGAEEYITKPFDPQELLLAVRARLAPPESHESDV